MNARQPDDGQPPRVVDERLADWVDGRISERERERLIAEMRVNPQLRADLDRYERTVRTVRSALQAPGAKVNLADRVMAAIAATPTTPARSTLRFTGRSLWLGLASAAALLVAALWLNHWHGGASTADHFATASADAETPTAPADKPAEKKVAEGAADDVVPAGAANPGTFSVGAPQPVPGDPVVLSLDSVTGTAGRVPPLADPAKRDQPAPAVQPATEPAATLASTGAEAERAPKPAGDDARKLADLAERSRSSTGGGGVPGPSTGGPAPAAPAPTANAPVAPVAPDTPVGRQQARDELTDEAKTKAPAGEKSRDGAAVRRAEAEAVEELRSGAGGRRGGAAPGAALPAVPLLPMVLVEGIAERPAPGAARAKAPRPAGADAGGEVDKAKAPLDGGGLQEAVLTFLGSTGSAAGDAVALTFSTQHGELRLSPLLDGAWELGGAAASGGKDNSPAPAASASPAVDHTWLVEGARADLQVVLAQVANWARARQATMRSGETSPPPQWARRVAEQPAAPVELVPKVPADGKPAPAAEPARLVLRIRLRSPQ